MTNNTRTLGKTRVAALITAAIITLAVFTGCPNAAKPEAPAPKHAVSFSVEGSGGTLKAKADGITETDMSPITVEQGKTVTFTAVPNENWVVKKWTISGGSFVSGGTEDGTTATVKITAGTTVKVIFTDYKSLDFDTELDNYLKSSEASATEVNYIEVTGLRAADLKGDIAHNDPSPLGKVLSENPTKKVALKFKKVRDLTDMSYCFYTCQNLVKAPEIPANVTNMSNCFNASGITKAPAIPAGVTNMSHCFDACYVLEEAPAIPASVKNMEGCFTGCSGLKKVPVLTEGVENITSCFVNCVFEKAPAIPASVKNMTQCFQFCQNLKEVPAIPEGVKTMDRCFWGCGSLEMAPTIPKTVTSMGSCFQDCLNLKGAVLKCDYKNTFWNAFASCYALEKGGIKVPPTQLETYKTNAGTMGTDADKFAKDE
ncbi:leucine-rich repeat domain-containing protein [Treponema denticola]|uniref:leucine-rich repeat domain-containing protein n=1 Tax=Treponema denticola TaxID=158 RepID=UPI0020A404C6|nr:leucine-rich repeat domain-containing protein [Treponema denticola]UTD05444.1 leucine-rich repeat domain-containing protein [Treponema denticola]